MRYDPLLLQSNAGGSLETSAESAMLRTIGAVERVNASIGNLFPTPALRWQKAPGAGWFGHAEPAEFQFLVEPDGQVRIA